MPKRNPKSVEPDIICNADGSFQVTNDRTDTAKTIQRKLCGACLTPIGRSAYHRVNYDYYHHPKCTERF